MPEPEYLIEYQIRDNLSETGPTTFWATYKDARRLSSFAPPDCRFLPTGRNVKDFSEFTARILDQQKRIGELGRELESGNMKLAAYASELDHLRKELEAIGLLREKLELIDSLVEEWNARR